MLEGSGEGKLGHGMVSYVSIMYCKGRKGKAMDWRGFEMGYIGTTYVYREHRCYEEERPLISILRVQYVISEFLNCVLGRCLCSWHVLKFLLIGKPRYSWMERWRKGVKQDKLLLRVVMC